MGPGFALLLALPKASRRRPWQAGSFRRFLELVGAGWAHGLRLRARWTLVFFTPTHWMPLRPLAREQAQKKKTKVGSADRPCCAPRRLRADRPAGATH